MVVAYLKKVIAGYREIRYYTIKHTCRNYTKEQLRETGHNCELEEEEISYRMLLECGKNDG